MGRRRKTAKKCPHSDSCFDCPLPDCCTGDFNVNEILDFELYHYLFPEIRNPEDRKAVQQQIEKRTNAKLYDFDGEKKTLYAWSKALGISVGALYNRIEIAGWSVEKAFLTPTVKRRR